MSALDGPGASAITDHAFEATGEWWSQCRHCGLSEAAHVGSLSGGGLFLAETYRCPECVTARDFGKPMPHAEGCPR
jgi:hypothetical protein